VAIVGNLVANLSVNSRGFTSGLGAAQGGLRGFVGGITNALGMIGLAGMGIKTLWSGIKLLSEPIRLASELERAQVAFTTMLGSSEKADAMLKELETFAAHTPFEFPDLVSASRRLLALGFEANKVIPVLTLVGDATGALGLGSEGINRITLALGQMKSKGAIQAEEMRQLAEAGIPAWEFLAKEIGVGIPEAMKKVEQRAVPAAQGVNAIMAGMQARFGGGMQKQSQTTLGLFSTLKDNLGFILRDIGVALIEGFGLKAIMGDGNTMLEMFRGQIMPTISSLITTMGSGFASVSAFVTGSFIPALDFVKQLFVALGVGIQNWKLVAEIAFLSATAASLAFWGHLQHFFTGVLPALLNWFADNWRDVWFTSVDTVLTILANLGQNIRMMFTEIWDFIASGGREQMEFAFVGLMEGAANTLKELPQIPERAINEVEQGLLAQIDQLQGNLKGKMAEALVGTPGEFAAATAGAFSGGSPFLESGVPAASAAAKKTAKELKGAGALELGSKDALSSIFSSMREQGKTEDRTIKVSEDQLKEQEKQTALLQKLADAETGVVEV
jgi:tape measure domain-containing protein